MNKAVKKLVSALMCSVMLAGASVSVFAEDFTDMPNDWRTTAIENAVKNGLISGMGDGTVAPDAPITRAQMAAIIVRALGATKEADLSAFADVSENEWYYKELAKAVYMNAFSGDGQNMNPNNNITFQECFVVLSRVFGLYYRATEEEAKAAVAGYADAADIAPWAVRYYGSVVKNGYWDGGEKKLLTPTAYITRGEFAVVMDRLVTTYISEGTYTEVPEGNVVVRGQDVVLDGAKVAGDLLIADGVEPNKVTLKDINVSGRLVVRGCATPGMVEYLTKDGTTATKMSYTDVGVAPTGEAFDIQVIAPYVYVNLSAMKYTKVYTEKDTCVNLGNVQ